MSQNSLEIELKSLDTDLREIYSEFGTSSIYLKQYIRAKELDIYGYPKNHTEKYTDPIQLIGRVQVKHGLEEQSGLGKKTDVAIYTFHIIKSELKQHNVADISTDDIIIYQGNELNILSATPVTILGDFALQIEVVAQGKVFNSPHFGVTTNGWLGKVKKLCS